MFLTTNTKNKNNGFTVIEIVIVLAIFLFIVGAAMGIFISVIQGQRRVLAQQQFLNQISYIEEYMSKALRMAKTEKDEGCLVDWESADPQPHPGYIYLLTRYDAGLQAFKGIKFINQSAGDTCQEFFLDDTTDPNNPVLKEIKGSADALSLTSSNFKINFVKFSVNGSDGSTYSPYTDACPGNPTQDCGAAAPSMGETGAVQPRVTILLNITIPGESPRTIQTTISRRNLNIVQ